MEEEEEEESWSGVLPKVGRGSEGQKVKLKNF